MTTAKIAISLPTEQLQTVRSAVRAGRAASVSAYVARAIERQAREDSLSSLVADLIAQHGQPSAKDRTWANRVLKPRRKPKSWA